MPRIYKRKTEKGKWQQNDLQKAIDKVNNQECSLRCASKEFQIPFSTLQERFTKQKFSESILGRKPVFTIDQEEMLTKSLKAMSKICYGLTVHQVRCAAFSFAEENNIHHNFNHTKKQAGIDWFKNFMRRNATLSVRKPEATSFNRVTAFNKVDVNEFYDNLEMIYSEHNFAAAKIWNVDETGVSNVQQPEKIVAIKGAHRVASVTSGERGRNVTIICAMSASGAYIPPMFIYPRKRMMPSLCKNGPEGAIYHCSPNGWSNSNLFLIWLQHFKDHTLCSLQEKVLLILDNHVSHISLESFNFCRDNGIVMLTLVPHTSHRMQPLDVSFFGPFKKEYKKECDSYIKKKCTKITHNEIAELVNKSYCAVASIQKGISGFSSTGIYPYNRYVFSEDELQTADVVKSISNQSSPFNNVTSNTLSALFQPMDITTVKMTNENNISINDLEENNIPIIIINSENKVIYQEENSLYDSIYMENIRLDNSIEDLQIYQTDNTILQGNNDNVASSTQTKKIYKSRKQKSVILTNSPVKKVLEEQKLKRLKKEEMEINKKEIAKRIKQEKKEIIVSAKSEKREVKKGTKKCSKDKKKVASRKALKDKENKDII